MNINVLSGNGVKLDLFSTLVFPYPMGKILLLLLLLLLWDYWTLLDIGLLDIIRILEFWTLLEFWTFPGVLDILVIWLGF